MGVNVGQMPQEVARCADALLDAIRRTEDFQEYQALKQSVMADEVNRRLLDRFMRAQTALQVAALTGNEAHEEDTREFERLSALLYQSPEITDYLLAQMRVRQLVGTAMERIAEEADIHFEINEA